MKQQKAKTNSFLLLMFLEEMLRVKYFILHLILMESFRFILAKTYSANSLKTLKMLKFVTAYAAAKKQMVFQSFQRHSEIRWSQQFLALLVEQKEKQSKVFVSLLQSPCKFKSAQLQQEITKYFSNRAFQIFNQYPYMVATS